MKFGILLLYNIVSTGSCEPDKHIGPDKDDEHHKHDPKGHARCSFAFARDRGQVLLARSGRG